MRNQIVLVLALLSTSSLVAQISREAYGTQLMTQYHYSKAFDVWSDLAESEDESWERKLNYARNAADCALHLNQLNLGMKWSELIVQYGDLNYLDVIRHIQFLRGMGRANEVEKLIHNAMQDNPEESRFQLELEIDAQVIQLLQDSSKFEIERFRRDAESDEFAAFPFDGGLVFMTNGIHTGILGFLDQWTRKEFNTLTLLEDVENPSAELPFLPRMQGGLLFDAFDRLYTHMGPVAFNANETQALLTRNASELDSTAEVRISRLQLEVFKRTGEEWMVSRPFDWNSTRYSHGHGAFVDDNQVVFMSDRPGGYGGTDLYRSYWDSISGSWTEPENLGAAVNTEGNELFPHVTTSGNLFFASDGHPGAGGLDVYLLVNGGQVVNRLGYPINTHWDDFAFWFDDLTGDGWLSSDRNERVDAIYKVVGEPMVSEVEISLVSCDGSALGGALIQVRKEGEELSTEHVTNDEGKSSFFGFIGVDYEVRVMPLSNFENTPVARVRIGGEDVKIEFDLSESNFENRLEFISSDGVQLSDVLLKIENSNGEVLRAVTNEEGVFQWSSDGMGAIATKASASLINCQDFQLEFAPPPPGCSSSISETIVLNENKLEDMRIDLDLILYDLGSASLRPSSKVELDKLVQYLQSKPDLKVELSSHTDCRNDQVSNQRLSQARAESCVNYIIQQGISAARIVAKGYGETRLTNACSDDRACGCVPAGVEDCEPCSEAQHQQNRRTELRLLAE
ncbi:OmpA family protein [Flavobacteriales bacterium]|nr:OmpA family protein [Flavobacteriales bacterium]